MLGRRDVAHRPFRHLGIEGVVLFEDDSAFTQGTQSNAVGFDREVEQFWLPKVARGHNANSPLRPRTRRRSRGVVNTGKEDDGRVLHPSLQSPELHLQMPLRQGVGPVAQPDHGGLGFGTHSLLFHPQDKPSVQPNDKLFHGVNLAALTWSPSSFRKGSAASKAALYSASAMAPRSSSCKCASSIKVS